MMNDGVKMSCILFMNQLCTVIGLIVKHIATIKSQRVVLRNLIPLGKLPLQ